MNSEGSAPVFKPVSRSSSGPMAGSIPGPIIGQAAPDFEAMTTQGPLALSDFRGSWLVFFAHPADFTPVCTTEFLAFAQRAEDFRKMNTALLGLSVDGLSSHLAWLRQIENELGQEIPFPIIADTTRQIARQYHLLSAESQLEETVRGVFIIDPEGILRLQLIYPMTIGRNIDEIIRCVAALQYSQKKGVATPANWQKGQKGLQMLPSTIEDARSRACVSSPLWWLQEE